MKKIIIAALIIIGTTAKTFAGPIVTIHFEIGRQSQGCTKFGICNWGVSVARNSTSDSNGSVQIIENTNSLLITLTKEAVSGKEEFLKGNTVTFEEQVVVPSNILKGLEAKDKITILPGTYKLARTNSGYQINIPLN